MRNLIVAAAVAAACLTSTAFAADETTKISGKTFIDFTNIDASTNGTAIDGSGLGVDVKRFYLSVDHNFDDVWAADLTTDFQNLTGASLNRTASAEVYVKKAYIQAKINDAFVLRVGSADLPWVPFVEGLYGYRYLELVMTDRTGFATSADWGLHASGKAADGMFNYAVSVVNGRGYRDLSRSKTMDMEGRVSLVPVKGLTVAAGFRSGKLGQETETNPAEKTASRFDALLAYTNDTFRAGVEYFTADNYSNSLVQQTAATIVSDKADGTSVWGSFNINKQVALFARFEDVKPSKTLNSAAKNQFTTAGVSYTPRKNVDLALAYKQTKVDSSATSTTKTNEIGIWSQIAF